MRSERRTVYIVSSPEHGRCYLTSLTAALQHVKQCVKLDDSDQVTLKRRRVTQRFLDSLTETCEYWK